MSRKIFLKVALRFGETLPYSHHLQIAVQQYHLMTSYLAARSHKMILRTQNFLSTNFFWNQNDLQWMRYRRLNSKQNNAAFPISITLFFNLLKCIRSGLTFPIPSTRAIKFDIQMVELNFNVCSWATYCPCTRKIVWVLCSIPCLKQGSAISDFLRTVWTKQFANPKSEHQ